MEAYSDSFLTSLHRIDNNLYLGGILGASNSNLISRLRITSIVQILSRDAIVKKHKNIRYLEIKIDDLPSVNINRVIPDAIKFIHREMNNGGVVLIHCAAGVSRSGSVAIAYFMAKYSLNYQTALARVRKGRGCVCPNAGFERQLKAMDVTALKNYMNGSVLS
ncbi:hypothetical protein SteCoe_23454 [Stentor coeruleus]|uniref:Protein-tyrosine-phosphatase n=1 Tax=Stentor coeruleus TaxID=5963 RepID=A0A1R2BJV2_9CILI|nr:hypothetical protein SteCoe_23454 [Stentor coeruleus]